MLSDNNKMLIILGNEKGGCGKTTTAIHVITSLLYNKYKVASIDLDSRQRSLTSFIENRKNFIRSNNSNIPFPTHFIINQSINDSRTNSEEDEKNRFQNCLNKAMQNNDIIVIDAPGNDTYLSRIAHSFADIVITPINDSFVDLNVLAKINANNFTVETPNIYSEIIWEAKKEKAKREGKSMDWFVVRNRLSNINAKNKVNMSKALENFSKRLGCMVLDGFSERVIFRELYLKGLSLLDLNEIDQNIKLQMSHLAAREELRNFMCVIENVIKKRKNQRTLKAS